MSETHPMKLEAAQWIERRMDGVEFDEQAFASWLALDPRHRTVFDNMWRRVMGTDMDAALGAYARRRASKRPLIAGSIVAVLVIASAYRAIPLVELQLATPKSYAVAEGGLRKVTLEDGTRLALTGGAELKVRYTRHDRVIELAHGTIFADVAHDAARPFQIDTGSARIVDVGTSFEVSSKPGNVRVTVASGVVRFGKSGWFSRSIDLNAKQAATLDENGLKRNADIDLVNVARWRGEWAEYKGVPLRQVIGDLQSTSPLRIVFSDGSLADNPTSGRIRLTDPVGQLENLSIIYGFRVRRTQDALVISKN